MRRPLDSFHLQHPGASGPHEGIKTANLPWEVYLACAEDGRFNVDTYRHLHTTVDYAGLLDILEARQVQATWSTAAYVNATISRGGEG